MTKNITTKLVLASAVAATTVLGVANPSFASNAALEETAPITQNALAAQGTLTYPMNQTSTAIYLNGSITVTVNTANVPAGYFIDVLDNNNNSVAQKDLDASSSGQQTFTFNGLYGYHKVKVYSEEAASSTFSVKW